MVSEEFLQKIISVADDAVICIDDDYRITFFNEGAERTFGYARVEIIGFLLTELIPDPAASNHDQLIEEFGRSGETSRRMAERSFVRGKRKGGQIFPAQVSIMRGTPGSPAAYAAILRDVSLFANLEERVLLGAALDASNATVLVADATQSDYPLVYATDAFERLTGYGRDEVLGKNCRFLHGEGTDPAAVEEIRTGLRNQVPTTVILRNYRKDGSAFWNRLELSPVHGLDGKVQAFVGVLSDVTAERNREQSFTQEQRLESLGSMAGNIAHEINNWIQPTLASRSILEPYLSGGTPSEVYDFLSRLEESGEHIRRIVRDVLKFSRVDESTETPERIEFDVPVKEAIEFVRRILPPGVSVSLNLDDVAGLPVLVSKTGMFQIVTNLSSNAARAMEGQGTLLFHATTCEIGASDATSYDVLPGRYCRLDVLDDGPGLPKDCETRVFDPFFSTARDEGGTGLGLSVVHGLVKDWNGCIFGGNHSNGGAVFSIYIPIVETNDEVEGYDDLGSSAQRDEAVAEYSS